MLFHSLYGQFLLLAMWENPAFGKEGLGDVEWEPKKKKRPISSEEHVLSSAPRKLSSAWLKGNFKGGSVRNRGGRCGEGGWSGRIPVCLSAECAFLSAQSFHDVAGDSHQAGISKQQRSGSMRLNPGKCQGSRFLQEASSSSELRQQRAWDHYLRGGSVE